MSFQSRVGNWVEETFGKDVASDKKERILRFFEEAVELAQACGMPADFAKDMIDHIYSKEPGVISQEVGGVAVTLSAFCNAHGLSLIHTQEAELERVEKLDKSVIRNKHNNKKFRNASIPQELIT